VEVNESVTSEPHNLIPPQFDIMNQSLLPYDDSDDSSTSSGDPIWGEYPERPKAVVSVRSSKLGRRTTEVFCKGKPYHVNCDNKLCPFTIKLRIDSLPSRQQSNRSQELSHWCEVHTVQASGEVGQNI
jgi:hypothetical protein